jgi:hypothetical protein
MQLWRSNKDHQQSSIPIPLWRQIFALSESHNPNVIRQLLGISKSQYEKKLAELFPQQQPSPKPLSTPAASVVSAVPEQPSIEFCEVSSDKPSATISKSSKSKATNKHTPHYEEVPRYIGVNTVIVEFCRADGKIMKIHTTSHCFKEIIDSFYTGAADVTGNF